MLGVVYEADHHNEYSLRFWVKILDREAKDPASAGRANVNDYFGTREGPLSLGVFAASVMFWELIAALVLKWL